MTDTMRLELSGGKHFAIIDREEFERPHEVEFRDGRVWTGRAYNRAALKTFGEFAQLNPLPDLTVAR